MNSKLYRCGWCGHPTDKQDRPLDRDCYTKAVGIIKAYGDGHTIKVNGDCCSGGDRGQRRVSRSMAQDAGIPGIEGTLINW